MAAPTCRDVGFFGKGQNAAGLIDLKAFARVNMERCATAFAPPHGALALVACISEEVGELSACVLGIVGEKKRKAHLTAKEAGDEIADVVTYLDLLATTLGLSLNDILRDKFNRVSERCGSPARI